VKHGFVFWEQELRVAGPGSTVDATARLNAQLAVNRLSMRDRLAGLFDGSRLRVWKASQLVRAGDTVEFEGSLLPAGGGAVIEGKLHYKLATKVQFVGLPLIGLGLVAVGLYRSTGVETLGAGIFVLLFSLLWIYSSAQMRHEQIEYIQARLTEAVAKDAPRAA
jgi:hypothetical protein